MKKLLVVAMVAAFATTASAFQLSLRFTGANAVDDTNALLPNPTDSVTVEVLWTQSAVGAANGIAAVMFTTTTVPEDPAGGTQGDLIGTAGLSGSLSSASLPGWSGFGTAGNIGVHQFAVWAPLPGAYQGVGTTVVGTFELTGNIAGVYQTYIQRNNALLTPTVADGSGTVYVFNPNPPGYGEFNIGNGFAGEDNGTGAIPMNIIVAPEPAALALLALGGIAVLRRRS